MGIISSVLGLLGALGVFLYGMRIMSDGIQKVAGERLHSVMNFMTSNRFKAVFTGFFITALIQSSSATTVMVVSFVNASLLNLVQAIGVIMGANIGTTVTTWLVSFLGFKFKIEAIAIPIIGIGFPFILSKLKKRRDLGEILVGFGLLFLGLALLKESVPDIKSHPEVLAFLRHYTDLGFGTFLIFVFAGTLLTIIVQSSSAAMAITVTMAAKGWIDFPTAAMIVLGENIGTTITAYLASIGTTVNARRAARAHFLFNTFGVIWIAVVFNLAIKLIVAISPWDTTGFLTNSVTPDSITNIPLSLSLFHSLFNITNTILFIPFIKPFARLVEKLVHPTKRDEHNVYKLEYISTGVQDTANINILKAKNEIMKLADITLKMYENYLSVFFNPDKKMASKVEEVSELENLTDTMREEISKYLVECSKEELSETSVQNISAMMRIVNEIESVADSIFSLLQLAQRKYDKKIKLHPEANDEIKTYSQLVGRFILFYKDHLNEHLEKKDLKIAYELEDKIDQSRNQLRKKARYRLQSGADVKAELLYIDMLRHFEHIGDKALNIAEALRDIY